MYRSHRYYYLGHLRFHGTRWGTVRLIGHPMEAGGEAGIKKGLFLNSTNILIIPEKQKHFLEMYSYIVWFFLKPSKTSTGHLTGDQDCMHLSKNLYNTFLLWKALKGGKKKPHFSKTFLSLRPHMKFIIHFTILKNDLSVTSKPWPQCGFSQGKFYPSSWNTFYELPLCSV